MPINGDNNQLTVPCLRATMGDWTYYTGLMSFEDIANRIRTAEEIHTHKGIRDLLQRALTKRADNIAEYLKSQPQHFFNAIIVGIYDGEPKWLDIEVRGNNILSDDAINQDITDSIGVLVLSGEEKIFAIDGQHRLEGIKKAIVNGNDLSKDEQTVIFVAHRNTPEGMERTRRLFSTLNRYAKPVSLPDIIALDEDDVIAIITRQLLESFEMLSKEGVILVSKSKSVPRHNHECFTSLQALYEFMEILLLSEFSVKQRIKLKSLRPSDSDIANYYIKGESILISMREHFTCLQNYSMNTGSHAASAFRNGDGGHLLFRPAGLYAFGRALVELVKRGVSISEAIASLSKLELILSQSPWVGLLWEEHKKRMITSKTNQNIAARLMLFMTGLEPFSEEKEEKLLFDYSAALNREISEVHLPTKSET